MKRTELLLAILLLGPVVAQAQSKEETIEFIKSEFKAFESKEYMYKDLSFSPAGDAFTIRRSAQGDKDYLIQFNLKDVEIYRVTINHGNGINKHALIVRNRGRETNLGKDGFTFKGGFKITPNMENEKKCLALERAFTRLTMLTTDRKFLFYDPVVPK